MISPLASPACPVFLSGRFLNRPSQPLGVVLLRFKFPFSFLLAFFPIIYLHAPYIFLCAQIAAVSMSLKRRFSCSSRLAHVFQFFFFFFSRCALLPLSHSLALPSLSPREPAFRPRPRGSPQLDFPRFAYFLLHSLPLHLRVSAVARILFFDLSPRTAAATLRSHFFFGTTDFCDP